jgi:integrase
MSSSSTRKAPRLAATDSPLVESLARDWLAECRAQGKRASTMHGYAYAIEGVLLPFCLAEGILSLDQLGQPALNRLAQQLQERPGRDGEPISKYTIDAYLRPVRHFTGWAQQQGHDILGRPVLPRASRPRPKDVLTRSEIRRMEDAAYAERDKLLVRVLGDTGMRIGELCALRPRDLVERNRQWFLYVQGKGGNDRFVPVPRIWRRIQTWVERGRRQPCADRIFVALRGNGFRAGLGYSGAYEVIRNAATDAGIGKRVHPHLLRHSLITHLRRKGYNDAQISLIVGNFSKLDLYTWMESSDAYGLMADLD